MSAGNPPCDIALDYLQDNEVKPVSNCLPPGSALLYIPARKIRSLFDEKAGLTITLKMIFLCPCIRCVQDGGSVDDRATHFNIRREKELRGDYALIYALLIYIRRPGLIRKFQRHERKLQGTEYLNDGSFEVFKGEKIHRLEVIQRHVIDNQYSFLVRSLKPYSDITAISPKELLPIKEDPEPKGEGTFAEVRCFEFQDDEYRSDEFGEITRFARKIFKPGMSKPAAKEWNNLQSLSKEEDHAHLMVALGAFWHGPQFFILQQEADQSLHDYLKGQGDEFESQELWKQMNGVADGLATLHRLYNGTKIAYHQDLKPANILIVRRTLKVADFGLLEFKPVTLLDDSSSTGVPNTHNTGYYAAPRQGKYTRDSDVWSLGCIMSELATCDIQGRDEVKKYRDARIANAPSGKDTPRFFFNQVVKDSVLDRHKSLYNYLQSKLVVDKEAASIRFQKDFYTTEFFTLLNSMFKHTQESTNPLMSSLAVVPDADHIGKTIDRLRKVAFPASTLDNRIRDLTLKQHLPDADVLNSSLMIHITKFKEILNKRNRTEFPTTTIADLKQSVANLQVKQCNERRQRGLKRLQPFLDRFEEFGELIKTLPCFKEIMAFIWGPVKFLLEVTDCRTEAFGDIVEICGQIGRSQASLSMYQELFEKEPDLTNVLSEAYKDIVQVNLSLVLYFQQRRWTTLFTTTWRRHKSRLSAVMDRMMSRFNLVSDRATVSQFDSFRNASLLQDEQHLATVENENLGRRHAVYTWLKPTDMEYEQDYLARTRKAYPDTCRWLFNNTTFKEWFDPHLSTTTVPKLLWLNGKPGAGKSVLASLVVEETKRLNPACTVLFFYFKQKDSERNSFVSMARTFLMQILEQNRHALDYFYSRCCSGGGALLTSRAVIEELLQLALKNLDSAYIVLDGLDKCRTRKERGDIVSWFREMIVNLPLDVRDQFHCLFVSQDDSARKDYRDLAKITIDAGHNKEDIEAFSKMQSQRLVERLNISDKQAREIAASVSASAEGVFLFAHLVWINLCGQSSIDSLEREVNSFPTNLDKLDKIYARIMRTIMDKPVRAERDEALMLLGWLVCAKRSLKMHEVQTMKSFDFNGRNVEFARRHFRVHLKELCESLVDIRKDGTIELVHMTARSYLANTDLINVVAEELRLAKLCIDYLNLPSFREPISEKAVLAGEYGFMEYAVLHWPRHLEAGLKCSPSRQDPPLKNLAKSLDILVERHWNGSLTDTTPIPKGTREMLQAFTECANHLEIEQLIALTNEELKNFDDTRPERSASDFRGIISAVRHCLEGIAQNNPDQALADDLEVKYGTHLFKCSRFSCKYFAEGFPTSEEREQHVERHDRPARCTDEHCRGSKIGFATKAQLERHLRENHHDGVEPCPVFPTEEEKAESVQEDDFPDLEAEVALESQPDHELPGSSHIAETEMSIPESVAPMSIPESVAPMSIPERVAPLEPTWDRGTTGTTKRQKTKKDFVCEHCDKKFDKKFNWQSHLATHMGVENSFPCPHCDTKCARRSDLDRHKKLHDPQSSVTCGGVLPNGQRWGCGKQFGRADTLRTHHKSEKGMQCIANKNLEEHSGPSTLSPGIPPEITMEDLPRPRLEGLR